MDQRNVELSDWCNPKQREAKVIFWPVNDGDIDDRLRERITIVIRTGAANTQLSPTVSEARDLIAALQWAIESAERVTAEAA